MGKEVVPITQALDAVPSDMGHHRTLKYLPNAEGLAKLADQLAARLTFIVGPPRPAPGDDDLIPF